MPNKEAPEIQRWETTEINPQTISEVLGGTLIQRDGYESSWDIHLNYGRRNPVLTLMIDPKKRDIFLAVPARKRREEQLYRSVTKFVNVESLVFYQYENPETAQVETAMVILIRDSGTGLLSADAVVSNVPQLHSITMNKTAQ